MPNQQPNPLHLSVKQNGWFRLVGTIQGVTHSRWQSTKMRRVFIQQDVWVCLKEPVSTGDYLVLGIG